MGNNRKQKPTPKQWLKLATVLVLYLLFLVWVERAFGWLLAPALHQQFTLFVNYEGRCGRSRVHVVFETAVFALLALGAVLFKMAASALRTVLEFL